MLILPNDVPKGITDPEDFNIETTIVPYDRFIQGLGSAVPTPAQVETRTSTITESIQSVKDLVPPQNIVQGQEKDPFSCAVYSNSTLLVLVDCSSYGLGPVTTFVFAILWSLQRYQKTPISSLSRAYGVLYNGSESPDPVVLQTTNLSEQFLHAISTGMKPPIRTSVFELDTATPQAQVNDTLQKVLLSMF